jgi:uncharacterized protein (TIGR02300 family)
LDAGASYHVAGPPVTGEASDHAKPGIDSGAATDQVKPRFFQISRTTLLGIQIVAKPELGTKRLCAGCGAKFYDLSKTPIVCPKCGTVYEIAPATRPRGVETARAGVADEVTTQPSEAEFVSLEEADAEKKSGKVSAVLPESEDDIEIEDELDDGDDDSTFIAEEEEGEDDVTDIIGDVATDEET